MTVAVHLAALSSLLSRDPEAGQLHTRHLQILAHLCASDAPMIATNLATTLAMSASQLSRLLVKLENRGLISRSDPRHRPMLFAPTDQGRALDARVRAHVDACLLDRRTAA